MWPSNVTLFTPLGMLFPFLCDLPAFLLRGDVVAAILNFVEVVIEAAVWHDSVVTDPASRNNNNGHLANYSASDVRLPLLQSSASSDKSSRPSRAGGSACTRRSILLPLLSEAHRATGWGESLLPHSF
jgi:hypothetical protein